MKSPTRGELSRRSAIQAYVDIGGFPQLPKFLIELRHENYAIEFLFRFVFRLDCSLFGETRLELVFQTARLNKNSASTDLERNLLTHEIRFFLMLAKANIKREDEINV